MRKTLLTSAAVLGFALALPAFAQTATDPNPVNPSAIKDGSPAAGTGSGSAPGNDPATAGKTGATLGNKAPQQDPGPLGTTTNPAPASSDGSSMSAPATGTGSSGASSSGMSNPSSTSPDDATPAKPRHRSVSSNASSGSGHWAHQPGTGESGPASSTASNIDSADTHSTIAPHLPSPRLGENAGPERYLEVAEKALKAHKTGEAQQALEMAETRLLDRSTEAGGASQPDNNPRIAAVTAARKSLADKDWAGARRNIQTAMNGHSVGEAEPSSGAMSSGAAPSGGTGSAGMSSTGTGSTGEGSSGMGNSGGMSGSTGMGNGGVANGNPGATPAPMDPAAQGPATPGAAGSPSTPSAATAPNPINPGSGAK
jgi:hypothetical protein